MIRRFLVAAAVVVASTAMTTTAEVRAAPIELGVAPKSLPMWAFCGVHPDDPIALESARTMATVAGIDATFGPCNVPVPEYSVIDTKNRYVEPEVYMRLVELNASVGMKTLVFDKRLWSDDPKVRDEAKRFWEPVYPYIQAWDLGDEFQAWLPEWQVLIHRWNIVRNDVSKQSGIPPFTNHLAEAVDEAIRDLPGATDLVSFTRYTGDLATGVARDVDAQVKTVMCGVNTFTHLIFTPTPAKIRNDMRLLREAGCDQYLIFGGMRVYDSDNFGDRSLTDPNGEPTSWAAAVLEGSGLSSYVPVNPARVLETRRGLTTVDGQLNGIGVRRAGRVTEVQVAGRAGVRADATSAVLNVTVAGSSLPGYLTVYPCGTTRPTAAQVNHAARQVVSTSVVAKLSASGSVCVFTFVNTEIVIDVNGYYPAGAGYTPAPPARLLDSRVEPGAVTVDGGFQGIGRRLAGTVTALKVTGRGDVPDGASSVVLNLTATGAAAAGFATVFSCDHGLPNAAQLNYGAGETVTNAVVAPLTEDGHACIYTLQDVDLIADVNGYNPAKPAFVLVQPSRLLDSRPAPDGATIDGRQVGLGLRAAGSVTQLDVGGRAGVSSAAKAVVINLTVTQPDADGYVTVYPCGSPRPTASNVNYAAGATMSNLVVADVGDNGDVCLYTMSAAHLIVDIGSWHP